MDSQVRGSGLGPLPRAGTKKVHAEVDGADGREGRLAGENSLSRATRLWDGRRPVSRKAWSNRSRFARAFTPLPHQRASRASRADLGVSAQEVGVIRGGAGDLAADSDHGLRFAQ